MKRSYLLRQLPTALFISLGLMTAVACQLSSSQPPVTPVDTGAIVQEVVATVQAQQPETQTIPPAPEIIPNTSLPAVNLDLQEAFINIYRQVNPAVVHIRVFTSHQDFNIPLGTGSGFIFDNKGHIITNNHVVTDGDGFEVVFADGSRSEAVVVGTDVDSDLAVIKAVQLPPDTDPVKLGDSSLLQVGEFVAAIGNPFDETGSMSIGIVSGLGRTLESQRVTAEGARYTLPQVIQTDAAINPGNSGGPLLNLNGEVIGVNSAILTRTGTNSGVGFSIPVDAVKRIAPALITKGAYTYPFMGISMRSADFNLQELVDLPQSTGAYITDVTPGSPADKAGLIGSGSDGFSLNPGGDLIIAINDQLILDSDDLISYLIFETEVNQTVDLTIIRDNEEITVPLTLGARP